MEGSCLSRTLYLLTAARRALADSKTVTLPHGLLARGPPSRNLLLPYRPGPNRLESPHGVQQGLTFLEW